MFDEITKELTSPDIQNLAFQRLCDSKLQTSRAGLLPSS
jgi:hypothetical protein